MIQAGVIVSDNTTLMVEILKNSARPEAGDVYAAMDMDWAWASSLSPTEGKPTDDHESYGSSMTWFNATAPEATRTYVLLREGA